MASTISAGTTSGTALNIQSDTTGNLAFKTGASNVTAMTLDSNQNVTFANNTTYTGTVTATSFSGAGTGLTGTASSLTVGTATNATNATGATQSSITSVPNLATVGTVTSGTWSGSFGAVSGANLTSLTSANLAGSRTIPKGTMPTGAILQVVQATTVTTLINNTGTQGTTNWVATSLTASITPTSSSSKILILTLNNVGGSNAYNQQLKIVRNGSTDINVGTVGTSNGGAAIATSTRQPDPDGINGVPMNYLDSPATTSSTSYTVYLGNTGGTQYQARFNLSVNNSTYTGNPLSTMILMEVAA